ncbi:uncharacterized protein At1g04910-like [Durio zibethinus]|uniref:O-fucosyltransferase family protein n=1 Tax=Durio zibethinus TaxID=66656 RepID=A0A6P6BF97_DURZI|nr:uncharacterized protein At1g04910-like [Durio zibethinus]
MEVNHTTTGGNKAEKMKTIGARQGSPLACIKFWVAVVSTMLLILWVCTIQLATLDDKIMVRKSAFYFPSFPPQRVYKNNGYLIISPNGGLNQKRLGICDMVIVARYLNVTLIVPKFAHGTYWNDTSTFADIFDVNHFITFLRGEVRILKELPPEQKRKAESEPLYYMFPRSFASLEYYLEKVLPRIQKHEILLFAQTDARLANNGLPEELQRLRCRVNYKSLRFTQPIEETGRKIVTILREKGPFLALHLRYEKDVLAFTGCVEGLTKEEATDVKEMRYSHDGWKHKPIDPKRKREHGSCPLTPEETALVFQALGIDRNTTIYIAGGEIYKKEKRMADLATAYPNLVRKETILKQVELEPFLKHADQMAAMDYIVAVESDIFIPTFVGNMANAVEGHRRYLGFKTTISLDRKLLVSLIDQYKNGTLSWDEFSLLVKKTHEDRTGKAVRRKEIPDHPRQEDYFYSNPQECLPPFAQPSNNI